MAKYKVVAINRRTQREVRHTFDGAPSEQLIAGWLGRKGGLQEWVVTRYYPSKKGWLIIDYQNAFAQPLRRGGGAMVLWAGIRRDPKPRPSLAAALMVITHRLALPEQLALTL